MIIVDREWQNKNDKTKTALVGQVVDGIPNKQGNTYLVWFGTECGHAMSLDLNDFLKTYESIEIPQVDDIWYNAQGQEVLILRVDDLVVFFQNGENVGVKMKYEFKDFFYFKCKNQPKLVA